MARLKQIPGRLGSAPTRFGAAPKTEADRSRQRMQSTPWRGWYGLARWKAKPFGLRWQVLTEERFTCRRCGRISADPHGDGRDMVADHITPHRGDADLFWARSNLQCLCKACHDQAKQAEERRGA